MGHGRPGGAPANNVETAFNLGLHQQGLYGDGHPSAGRSWDGSTLIPCSPRYWPDYPNPDVANKLTIRQLLEHRSGIGGNVFDAPKGGTRHDIRHNRDYLQLFAHEPLRFEPGSRQEYSNAG